jgi:endonuclease YncB( thermonuclease family)
MKCLAIILILMLFAPLGAYAHRDGCHSKHSCPSDTDSYVCGDKGYCSECPDNKYCKAGKPVSKIQINAAKAVATKAEVPHCIGNTLCIKGKVKGIIDGDTLQIDTYRVRLSLTNTPEKGQTGYLQAVGFTKYLCPVGSSVTVDQDDKQPFDRFKRLVGKVYCSEKLLNYELLENKHAKIMKQYCAKSEFGKEVWATKYDC